MPRKTKELSESENKNKKEKESSKATKTAKTTKKAVAKTTKKDETKTKSTKSRASKTKSTETSKSSKNAKTSKATKATKKVATKKSSEPKAKKEKTVKSNKKGLTKRINKKRKINSYKTFKLPKKKKVEVVEYYDLPYRYNQTVVKVLAQTPNNLFIYWDISDQDRKNFEKQYGENFFETTKPILIVHNDTLGYSFEVQINDFANSWYLHVNDAKCKYRIELGRRPYTKTEKINTDYIYVSMSNNIESPNDHILFEKAKRNVTFRNIKNGTETQKDISSLAIFKKFANLYNIQNIDNLYKLLYASENIEKLYNLSNPSSGNPSSYSNLPSSNFKNY